MAWQTICYTISPGHTQMGFFFGGGVKGLVGSSSQSLCWPQSTVCDGSKCWQGCGEPATLVMTPTLWCSHCGDLLCTEHQTWHALSCARISENRNRDRTLADTQMSAFNIHRASTENEVPLHDGIVFSFKEERIKSWHILQNR